MKEKKFLVVVDMQKDFIDGSLGTQEAQEMTPDAVKRIRECKAEGYTLIATLDTHEENYMDTAEGKKLPVPHCIRGTEGWALTPAVAGALEGKHWTAVEKKTFGSVDLPGLIGQAAGGEDFSIELLGLCTDICVVSNALLLKASFPEVPIAVRADCCAGVTPASHEAALTTMRFCQIDIL